MTNEGVGALLRISMTVAAPGKLCAHFVAAASQWFRRCFLHNGQNIVIRRLPPTGTTYRKSRFPEPATGTVWKAADFSGMLPEKRFRLFLQCPSGFE
jgi:hypothetical protein